VLNSSIRRFPAALAALAFALVARQAARASLSGAEVYRDACASCHGADGRGSPQGSAITTALPDFTDCVTATAESTANWTALIRHGGKFLGMSDQMPAFGDSLDDDEIRAVIEYVRGFCTDPRFPLGDLNFPRPLFVEKAFPENEVILSFDYESAGARAASWELALEKRVGARGQVEVSLPVSYVQPDVGSSTAGVGDLGLSYSYVLFADPAWRSIAAARLGVTLPTASSNRIGTGTAVFAPQLLAGQALGPLILQAQIAADLPVDTARVSRAMLYAFAFQYRLGPYKRSVVAEFDLQETQPIDSNLEASTALGPGLYVPLSRRGHVAISAGAQFPVAGARPFDWLVGSFLLWDFTDGPIWAW
jgi:mono/diheme cytochrome c family protein